MSKTNQISRENERKVKLRLKCAFEFFVRIYISDKMHIIFVRYCICIFYQLITSHFRLDAINPIKHNTQLYHISDEM